MKVLKKSLLFLLGLLVIPFTAVVFTSCIFSEIDFWKKELWEFLFFDYTIAYLIHPILYFKKIQKYITNRYFFFAIIFSVLWIIDLIFILIE